jgi:hypothetical protein
MIDNESPHTPGRAANIGRTIEPGRWFPSNVNATRRVASGADHPSE